jgi:hypothetical protein
MLSPEVKTEALRTIYGMVTARLTESLYPVDVEKINLSPKAK